MVESHAKELCLSLLRADSEEKVVDLLRIAGYGDNPAVGRSYGSPGITAEVHLARPRGAKAPQPRVPRAVEVDGVIESNLGSWRFKAAVVAPNGRW
jgi:hypothetical protein